MPFDPEASAAWMRRLAAQRAAERNAAQLRARERARADAVIAAGKAAVAAKRKKK